MSYTRFTRYGYITPTPEQYINPLDPIIPPSAPVIIPITTDPIISIHPPEVIDPNLFNQVNPIIPSIDPIPDSDPIYSIPPFVGDPDIFRIDPIGVPIPDVITKTVVPIIPKKVVPKKSNVTGLIIIVGIIGILYLILKKRK